MRRDAQQHAALTARLEDEPERTLLEVTQAPVDQSGGARARAAAEIGALHEGGADPPERRVARDARARDAAAHHQEIDGLRRYLDEGRGARPVRELDLGQRNVLRFGRLDAAMVSS
jgi:hypothetical protein